MQCHSMVEGEKAMWRQGVELQFVAPGTPPFATKHLRQCLSKHPQSFTMVKPLWKVEAHLHTEEGLRI